MPSVPENAHGDIAGFEMRSDRQPIRAGTDHGDLTITPWRCCVHGKLMRLREGSGDQRWWRLPLRC
jgi:hypothetical protein